MKRLLSHMFMWLLICGVLCPRQSFSATDREQEIREAVTAFVASRTAGMGWDVRIRRMNITGAAKLPEGAIDYEIKPQQQWGGWGTTSIAVVAHQKERVLRNITVRMEVEALADTVVALHQIAPGEVVSAADVVLQKREITYNSSHAVRTIDEVIGKRTRTTIRANQPLRADQVEKVPLVKVGQIVTIVAENEVMKISVSGKARSSGAEGDIVRVQNLSSFKEVSGRVIDASTVQVQF